MTHETNEPRLSEPVRRYHPLAQLVLARVREFIREPEAVFWVYGFPLLMAVALSVAFRNKPVEQIRADVQEGPGAETIKQALESSGKFVVAVHDPDTCKLRLRTGSIELVVIPTGSEAPAYEYYFDPTRTESVLARREVNDALQRAAGRQDPVEVGDRELNEPGGRYIDFLIPGLLGMSLMGGGLWGVGFVTVDMRMRKLLKRFLATPMKKTHFLLGLMISRLIFMVPEVLVLLVFAYFVFGVAIQGSLLTLLVLILLGAFTFSGIGLLVACRAKTLEAVSGLMNLVMLPMWMLSGIFFSSERFPDAAQPFLKALPLTPLNDALRAVILEGASLASQVPRMAILLGYGLVTFWLALKWFRWN